MKGLAPPRDLTLPEPGSTSAKGVLSAALRVLLRDLADLPRRAPAAAREEAVALDRLVRAGLREAPGALVSALRRPTVGTLVRCLRKDALPDRAARVAELLATLALELARTGSLPAPVTLRHPPARLLSLGARLAIRVPAGATIAIENGSVTIQSVRISLQDPAHDHFDHPYHPITGDIVLALADNNPLSLEEAHPDKEGNAIDLGGRDPLQWTASLADALGLVGRHLPDLRREMDLFVQQIVPVGWDAERHLSASYQEAIGTIYMTLHPSLMTLAEALIHEFSHNKINALFELDEVLENAWSPLYTSPVRPDPRPLHGVLLAVHAFLPVARLYERMIEAGDPIAHEDAFRQRYARIRQINREGAELVLREGRPTAVGRGVIEEIRRWDAHYGAVRD